MSVKKYKDIQDSLELIRSGIHPVWGFLPDAPVKRNLTIGKWYVDIDGDIVYDGYYNIQKERLIERDWIIHLMSKDWFSFDEFMPIYMQASFNAGLKSISFNIYY